MIEFTRRVVSLRPYEGQIRNLILDAKVGSRLQAIREIRRIWRESPVPLECVRNCHLIVPAPSSLWGRVRGRIDLAGLLAWDLSRRCDVSLGRPPFQLMWKWQKRAMKEASRRLGYDFLPISEAEKGKNEKVTVLFVDDVVTTGETLGVLAGHFPGFSHRFLTFARAADPARSMGRPETDLIF